MKPLDTLMEDLSHATTPQELAEIKLQLAMQYATLSNTMEMCVKQKADMWESFRAKSTSDTRAERAWEKTNFGLAESLTKLQMKKIDKLVSAVNSKLQIATMEAKSIW